MSENAIRKEQLRAELDRGGVMLDENYVARAKELYNAAAKTSQAAEAAPDFPTAEVEEDLEKARKCRPSAHTVVKIVILAFFILGVASLLLPLDPFASRLPIAGIFVGIGGIILFVYLLGADKRRAAGVSYRAILKKYGAESEEDIPMIVSKSRILKKEADEAYQNLLTFVRYADPEVSTPARCSAVIRSLDDKI
ncbi:MAG: hypothetical protein IKX85_04000, partial [Clostridia bacterium]|nr:hypothetical protein [Clostridia bacterium]